MGVNKSFRISRLAAFVLAIVIVLSAAVSLAQQPGGLPRVGFLGWGKLDGINTKGATAFKSNLRELGWIDGRNLIIEWRFAKGAVERVPDVINDFIDLKVAAMVLTGGRPLHIAKKATNKIPIVMMEANHPVATGLVVSLARPGGNITGMTSVRHELDGKRLEILKEIIPALSHVAVLWQSTRPSVKLAFKYTENAAKKLGIDLEYFGVKTSAEIVNAFDAMPKDRAVGLLAIHTQLISANRRLIVDLAANNRIPSIYPDRRYAMAGGLVSYGANHPALYAQAATYVDKILRGAKPAELPVERPTKFDLVVNLKAAKAMHIDLPESILKWADEVIQ